MRRSIKFLLGDSPRELEGFDPTLTVLDYLRFEERRTGTKEGCAEGDCGACTVVIARPDGDGERLDYRAVNACIQFMATLDGCQLITVEDLGDAGGALHPVQRAMVDAHASQCGFCTPGFVMSLLALYHRNQVGAPALGTINDSLAGNLCRCTGYGPIIAAASTIDGPPADEFAARETRTLGRLKEMTDDRDIVIEGADGRRSFSPATLDALADLLARHPEAHLLAGATDVGLWVTKGLRRLDPVIHLGRVKALAGIHETTGEIEIGAMASYADALPVIARSYPDFGEVMRRLGSVQIRNVATIGGNIANGSPIGDMAPPLIAAGASLTLRRGAAVRKLKVEDYFLGYGKQDLEPGEFITAITLPKPAPGGCFACYKISKRFDQDISAVLGAFAITLRGDRVTAARIAFGGMAATPSRAPRAEAALIGKPWSEPTVTAAMAALAEDFTPLDDLRASAAYRLQVAGNLLLKMFVESNEPIDRTRISGPREVAHG